MQQSTNLRVTTIGMSGTIAIVPTQTVETMTDTTARDDSGSGLNIRAANREDCGLILEFITELAEYEKLAHLVSATEERLADSLFGNRPSAEVVIAEWRGNPAGFALFFDN